MLHELITQARDLQGTTEPKQCKELEDLYVKIYDTRSGGRKAPKKVKIKEVISLLAIDNTVNT